MPRCAGKIALIRLFIIIVVALLLCGNAAAFAPKSMGVVTIEVWPVDVPNASTSSTLAIKVAIHSQIAIPDLQLNALQQPGLALQLGSAQWQGSIAAGETLQLDYQFETQGKTLQAAQSLCRFELYRIAAGMNQWLGSAEFQLPSDNASVQTSRVPLQMQAGVAAAAQRSAGSVNTPRYLIEYSLD